MESYYGGKLFAKLMKKSITAIAVKEWSLIWNMFFVCLLQ